MGFMPFGMFSFMGIIFPIFFTVVFGIFILTAIRGIGQWNSNNKQPVLTVAAKLVTKRTNTSHHHNHDNNMHSSTSTSYYATFEVESGDRMELNISGKEYGMLVEGDIGKLTFQGTRYHGFERIGLEDEQ